MTKSTPSITKSEANNWYELIPSKYQSKAHNPNFSNHKIKIPFRMGIVGFSGSGKTNLLMDLLYRMNGTFNQIILCIPCAHEPIYNYLKDKFKDHPDQFHVFEEGRVPSPNDEIFEDKDIQSVIVFDDMITFKNAQPKINEFFIRGRKIGRSTSVIYLSQNYYSIPKVARNQMSHIIIKKISGIKDRNMIMREFANDISKEQFEKMYDEATKDFGDFLMVDFVCDPKEKYRKGFLEVIDSVRIVS
jgi:hypothetical protein